MTEDKLRSWIPIFSQELDLSEKFRKEYEAIVEMDKKYIAAKCPNTSYFSSYPAGIAYIAALLAWEKRTQQQIADVAGCSTNSLRIRFRAIAKRNGIEVPE
jgi:transcription initiation factor TFIIIB Brf1 subunit/transcription initiation factor TFIIB